MKQFNQGRIRMPGLEPKSARQLDDGTRQSAIGDHRPVADDTQTDEPSGTIRPGRPVKRVVRKVLSSFGLTAHRGHG